jgi:oligoendopeptidase F
VDTWLAHWSRLSELVDEATNRYYYASTRNSNDAEAEAGFARFNEVIRPLVAEAEQVLKHRLLESGITPEGLGVVLKKMRVQAGIFRQNNLPLLAKDLQLAMEYYKIRSAETILWEGEQIPAIRVLSILEQPEREIRERAWKLRLDRWMEDIPAIDEIWRKMLTLRKQIAANAGEPDYRTYRWKQMVRIDYSPEDTERFHAAIEEVVVPVATRMYEKRRKRLGLESVRPWDANVDVFNAPPLKPFKTVDELIAKTAAVFRHVDPELAGFFDTMCREDLLDLDNRANKAPGGYSLPFEVVGRPVIFFSAVGVPLDVETMLHEGGHAFHTFEMARLPYFIQRGESNTPMEFMEVASTAMEMLGLPYLSLAHGGFYREDELARALYRKLEDQILFWPYMSVMDLFQHWVYLNIDEAMDVNACDRKWAELWQRFMPGLDCSGQEGADYIKVRWRIQGHLFDTPFYYIEYGLALLGAIQVWANALKDQTATVAQYRSALRLGGTRSLPELFTAAGARLAFDAETLRESVNLLEEQIAKIEDEL